MFDMKRAVGVVLLALVAICIHPAVALSNSGALALHATPVPGRNAVDITVTGPAQVPVTVTLTATIDPDLPTVTVARKQLLIGANGEVQERIALAPNYWEGSRVTITATSIDGVTPASLDVKVLRANQNVPVSH